MDRELCLAGRRGGGALLVAHAYLGKVDIYPPPRSGFLLGIVKVQELVVDDAFTYEGSSTHWHLYAPLPLRQ